MNENKEAFTKELGELLSRYDQFNVDKLIYEKGSGHGNDYEIVRIIYKDGYDQVVNVHMDSLSALARDVLRNIE